MNQDIQNQKNQLMTLKATSLTAQLKPLMPTITKVLEDGVAHMDVIKRLNEMGIKIKLSTFRKYLQRWRTEQKAK